MNQLIKPAKQALAKKFGYQNVSVVNGQGTAWGWVNAYITVKRANCLGDKPFYCENCRTLMGQIRKQAEIEMQRAWNDKGMKPYTFTSDDGYNTEYKDVIVQINLI